jgi:Gametolysin peptidase M11
MRLLPSAFTDDAFHSSCAVEWHLSATAVDTKSPLGDGRGPMVHFVSTRPLVNSGGSLYIKSKRAQVVLHEYLHNLGCEHSMLGLEEYGDPGCVMGKMLVSDLNAAQSYRLGWLTKAVYINMAMLRDSASKAPAGTTYALSGDTTDTGLVLFQEVIPMIKEGTMIYYGDSIMHALLFVSLRGSSVFVHTLYKNIESNGVGICSVLQGTLTSVAVLSIISCKYYQFDGEFI